MDVSLHVHSYKMKVIICTFLIILSAIRKGKSDGISGSCGHPLISTNHRIVGGGKTLIEAYPWQVSMRYNDIHTCGGTLIDDRWIITAAHCFIDRPGTWTVAMGISDLDHSEGHTYKISDVFVNDDFDHIENTNDIALVRLDKQVELSGKSIQPACLPAEGDTFDHELCTATGWGSLYFGNHGYNGSWVSNVNHLREVDLTIFSDQECRNQWRKGYDDRKLCAGYINGGKGTCQGDDGGPLVCETPTGWKLAGITSSGYGCGWAGSPGLFTKVERYLDWIDFIRRKTNNENNEVIVPNPSTPQIPETTPSITLTLTPYTTTSSVTAPHTTNAPCGRPLISTHQRIVGGHKTVIEAYPWQVSLRYHGNHVCGGTLIDDRWILTATHCFKDRPSGWTAALGIVDLRQDEGHVHTINDVIIGNDFDPINYFNDIALVRLATPVDITGKMVQPACLPAEGDTFEQELCTATGWGSLYFGNHGYNGSWVSNVNHLREVDLTIFSDQECRNQWRKGYDDRKVCAGYINGGKGTCQGDDGGPLVCETPTGWKLVGITSSGYGCGWAGSPGLFTKVERYLDWIDFIRRKTNNENNEVIVPNPSTPQIPETTPSTTSTTTPYTTTSSVTAPHTTNAPCGRPLISTHQRIVGGHKTVIEAYPWQVSLRYHGNHVCGGTLIDDRWILTATHCFKDRPSGWTAALGIVDLRQDEGHVHTINDVIIGNDFDPINYFNDIALVRLATPVDITGKMVQPACLPAEGDTFEQELCTATGWGSLYFGNHGYNGSWVSNVNHLREVDLTIFSDQECRNQWRKGYDDRKLCAGYINGGKGTCQGDDGGPLVCETPTGWKLAGITSSGYGCGWAGSPGLYTNVERYLDWIEIIRTGTNHRITTPTTTPLPATPLIINSTNAASAAACGHPVLSTNHRIVGGHDTYIEAYPWQASMRYYGDHICGGTLVDERWIVTAAHCFNDRNLESWTMGLGITELENDEGHVHDVSHVLVHDNYDNDNYFDDIALVRLAKPVDMSGRTVRAACLPSSGDSFDRRVCTATGWGSVYYGGNAVNHLREVDLTIFSYDECKEYVKDGFDGRKICAGDVNGGKDTCQGDSGGPLICETPTGWKLAGITSSGYGCGSVGNPGMYTKVERYLDWIETVRETYSGY